MGSFWAKRLVAIHICEYVCVNIHMYACICICIYRDICKAIHMYVRMHACIHVCKHACVHLCMYVCMHVCICICSMHVHVQLFQITCIACLGDMLSLHPLAIGKCIVPHAQKQHLQQYGDYEFVWDAWAHCIQNSLRHWASFVDWMIWWRWELRSWTPRAFVFAKHSGLGKHTKLVCFLFLCVMHAKSTGLS